MPRSPGRRGPRRCLAALLATAHATLPATTHADAPAPVVPTSTTSPTPSTSTVVLFPPSITGAADPTLPGRLVTDLRSGLARGQPVPVVVHATAWPAPCDATCLARMRDETGGAHGLRTAVSVDDRDYAIHLELVDLGTGTLVAESRVVCELCGLSELGVVVADQSALLRSKLAGHTRPPPALVITSAPQGAQISIDGVALGQAPLERALLPGKHRVRASLPGYVADEREVLLVPGVRETLAFSLPRSARALKLRAVGWTALATSIPLVGAGVGLLAIAGHDYPARCDGHDVDHEGDCRYVYTTTGSGAALLAVGAVVGVLAAVLLARTRDRGRARRLRATLTPTPTGLAGSF